MKKLFLLMSVLTLGFSLEVKHELIKCSQIASNASRLMCYDVITEMLKPTKKENAQAQKLIIECFHCHGGRWDIPTLDGSRAVRDMSQMQILTALGEYKEKKRGSAIMQAQVEKMTQEELALIAKYITIRVNNERY